MLICTSSLSKLSCNCKKTYKKVGFKFPNLFHFKMFEIKIKNIEKHEIGKNSFKRRTFERSKISKGPKAELVKNEAGRKQKLLSFG